METPGPHNSKKIMKVCIRRNGSWRGSQWMIVLLALATGCNGGQPNATGHVTLPEGSAFVFAGDTLELRAKQDLQQIAFGQLNPDGSFRIESLVDGKLVRGAREGIYQARIVIADDDYTHKAQAAKVIPKKYFSFETSGLTVQLPSTDIQLKLSK